MIRTRAEQAREHEEVGVPCLLSHCRFTEEDYLWIARRMQEFFHAKDWHRNVQSMHHKGISPPSAPEVLEKSEMQLCPVP
eukprot:11399497-Karenia_brevis.AAC.1